MIDLIGWRKDFGFVNVVYANGLKDLRADSTVSL